MILGVCWDGLWTLSFGLSQLHGHGSWLVCEVALTPILLNVPCHVTNCLLHVPFLCKVEDGSYMNIYTFEPMVGTMVEKTLCSSPQWKARATTLDCKTMWPIILWGEQVE